MAECIEREAAIEAIMNQRLYYTFGDPNSNQGAYNMVKRIMLLDAVKRIPAADVQPVVFCKDCMHSVQGKKSLECEKHRYVWNNMNRWVNDEDFCCWGAKREEI